MIIQESKLCVSEIEYFVNLWGQIIAGDLEYSVPASAKHVKPTFWGELRVGWWKGSKKLSQFVLKIKRM